MEKYLTEIREILLKNTGIRISEDKNNFLLSTINQIINKENIDPEKYIDILKTNENKIIELATYFTVQETSFYRNKDHFNTLKEKILPIIKENKKDKERTISILSAGCATGEEPYTIAMIVKDFFGSELTNWQINIYAIDISKDAIEEAKKGIYTEYKMKNIDQYYIDKYFEIEQKNSRKYYIIKNEIKEMITFKHENLLSENFINSLKLDIIFCENVIIYFDYTSTEKLINKFYNALNIPGYLFLGYSETLNMIKHNFNLCWNNQTYYYSKEQNCNEENKSINIDICYEKTFKDERASYEDFSYTVMKSYLKNDKETLFRLYKELLQIYSINPDFIKDEKVFLLFGEFFIDNNDISTARKMCEMALEKLPNSIDAHNLNAYIHIIENEPMQALFSLNISLKKDYSNKITLYLLYKVYDALKNKEKKIEILESLKKSNLEEDDSFFPYNSLRKIQFYGAINKILGEQQ